MLAVAVLTVTAAVACGRSETVAKPYDSAPPTSVTACAATTAPASPTASPAVSSAVDPSTWSARRLAAQLVFCSVPATNPLEGRRYARMGVGGIVILGGGARSSIGEDLAAVLKSSRAGVKPFIAGDEEGGQVQRLRGVIYPLPSARVMGGWSATRTRSTAKEYGTRMRKLHISVSFAPVADLDVNGRYMSSLDRCFSSEPEVAGSHVVAWVQGLRAAGVIATVKHWPGHGSASNTHTSAARIPARAVLQQRDMVPFERAFEAGVPMVMVGHLQSRGITPTGTPASLSGTAMRYLRSRVSDDTVIITDSLSMAATTSAVGIDTSAAAVRALRAGADLALFASASPAKVIDAVERAIKSGWLPRSQAEASAARILRLKEKAGLTP